METIPAINCYVKNKQHTEHPEHPEREVSKLLTRRYLIERDIYQDFLDFLVDNTVSNIGYFHLYNEDDEDITHNVWSRSVCTQCTTSVASHYTLKEAGIWADAIRKQNTVIHNDYKDDASAKGFPDSHFHVIRQMSAPIIWNNKIVAIIGVGNKLEPYSKADQDYLEHFVKFGWPIVQDRLQEYRQRIQFKSTVLQGKTPEQLMMSVVGTVAKALELRDEYTSHHQSNVAIISEKIAEVLELSPEQIYGIRLGAIVHDIGKIAIPSEILSKSGKLNVAEFQMVKMHASLGAEIFKDVELPWPILDIIEQHHERMDGTGYPKGLIGNAICLEARIVAVADTYDAMASDRPYRHAPGKEAAIEAIKKGRGVVFDAYVVDAFFAAIDKGILKNEELYGYE